METKSQAQFNAEFSENISRLFIFRFLWMYIWIFPLAVWGLWIGIISFLQFWYMLFTGKRHRGFWDRTVRFTKYVTKWGAYLKYVTDERPQLIED
ncbi:MAG: DUF4389 domain-containing protein [Candidatus Gracilibacteria bacterium]